MSFGIELPKIENANRYGSKGQRRNGVDILERKRDCQEWLGIQCKVKQNGSISMLKR